MCMPGSALRQVPVIYNLAKTHQVVVPSEKSQGDTVSPSIMDTPGYQTGLTG